MIEICVIGNSLLTRIEHNADTPASVKTVVLYNHGFPDSAVTPHALAEFSAVKGTDSPLPEHGFWASRFPRKVCEHLLKKREDVAFVAFNTRGIPGSSSGDPPVRIEEAPADFKTKTLVGDMEDITQVANFLSTYFPSAKGSFFIFGMSTGAFLALAFAARADLHPPGGATGCVTVACVQDIPASVSLDFSPEQLDSVQTKGVCTAPFFPHGAENNPQHWELGAGYIESYKAFPEMPALAAALAVPTLLIHGKDDIHVPFEHGETLEKTLKEKSKAEVTLAAIPKANHFFSSNSALNKALSALTSFIAAHAAPPPSI